MDQIQQAIDEMLPMISDFLDTLGMSKNGAPDFLDSLVPFSEWISAQEITQVNFAYLVSRIAAFYCHYHVKKCGAKISVENSSIQLTLFLGDEVTQSIDPFYFAISVANKQMTLEQVIEINVC